MAAIVRVVKSLGWALAPDKLCKDLVPRLKLLGFMLDTRTMTIGVPEARRSELLETAAFVLENREAVRARVVCQLIGQIVSLQFALGLVCRLRSRYLMLAVRAAATALD